MTRSLLLLAVIVWPLTWMSAASFAAPASEAELERNPKIVVSLRRGETKELQLCWDSGTGRVPIYFVSGDAIDMADRAQDDVKPYLRHGVSAEYLESQSIGLSKAMYASGQFTGSQPAGQRGRYITNMVIRLTATDDANLGAQSMFAHVLSGTGRSMLLTGEIRVLVVE